MSLTTSHFSDSSKAVSTDVVVIGAGLSGLQAALLIQNAKYSCIVLEATDHVGGKCRSVPSKDSGPGFNDLGATWINDSSQSEIYKLFRRYNLEGEIQRSVGKTLHETPDGSYIALPYGELPLSEKEGEAVGSLLAQLSHLVSESYLGDPENGPNAEGLDAITFKEFCTKQSSLPVIAALAEEAPRGLLGVDADEISALFLINYIKSGTGIINLGSDLKDGGQYIRARQGMQSISKGLASDLSPDTLHLSSPVSAVTQSGSDGCTVSTTNGATFKCRKIVVSVPSTLLHDIKFSPSLPKMRHTLNQQTASGYYSKMVYVFEKPWWREAGLSGIFQSNVGPVAFTRDTSIAADKQWSISCFIVGKPGRQWSKLSNSARSERVWEQFTRAFNPVVKAIPIPLNAIEMEWSKEPFADSPCPLMGPGILTTVGPAMKRPFGNIHFVGTQTSEVWKGYMEGAVRSGQRGAREVIESLTADDFNKDV